MNRLHRWLLTNEIYWALRISHACEGWAESARRRLQKTSGKLSGGPK